MSRTQNIVVCFVVEPEIDIREVQNKDTGTLT